MHEGSENKAKIAANAPALAEEHNAVPGRLAGSLRTDHPEAAE